MGNWFRVVVTCRGPIFPSAGRWLGLEPAADPLIEQAYHKRRVALSAVPAVLATMHVFLSVWTAYELRTKSRGPAYGRVILGSVFLMAALGLMRCLAQSKDPICSRNMVYNIMIVSAVFRVIMGVFSARDVFAGFGFLASAMLTSSLAQFLAFGKISLIAVLAKSAPTVMAVGMSGLRLSAPKNIASSEIPIHLFRTLHCFPFALLCIGFSFLQRKSQIAGGLPLPATYGARDAGDECIELDAELPCALADVASATGLDDMSCHSQHSSSDGEAHTDPVDNVQLQCARVRLACGCLSVDEDQVALDLALVDSLVDRDALPGHIWDNISDAWAGPTGGQGTSHICEEDVASTGSADTFHSGAGEDAANAVASWLEFLMERMRLLSSARYLVARHFFPSRCHHDYHPSDAYYGDSSQFPVPRIDVLHFRIVMRYGVTPQRAAESATGWGTLPPIARSRIASIIGAF